MRKLLFPFILLALGLFFTARSSCANKELIPFLGKWSGGFEVERVTKGADTADDRKRSNLTGFVQIYGSKHSFTMSLEGEQETLDLGGTWTMKGDRITLQVTYFKLDDQGGADYRNPNKKFVPADVLQAAYSRPLVLKLSPDKKHLEGLLISIGDLVGRHRFLREGSGR